MFDAAGVLGHEVGHLEHRHAARALVGDFSAVAAGAPALLSQMQYSRDMELEADATRNREPHRRRAGSARP